MMFSGILSSLALCLTLGASSDPPPLIMPGHVTIGVLSQLRHPSGGGGGADEASCVGPIRGWALQEIAALEWALTTINNQSSKDFEAGLKIFDSCGDKDRMMRQASFLLKENERSNAPLIGVIAVGSSSLVSATASFFHAYSVPLLTTHVPNSKELLEAENVFTTAPHLHAQIQAVLSVITRHRRRSGQVDLDHRLGVISGCEEALKILQIQAAKGSVEIHSTLVMNENKSEFPNDTMNFLKSQVGFQGTIIVLLENDEINDLVNKLDKELLERAQTFWVFSVLDGEPAAGELHVSKMREVFEMAVVVEPHSPLLPGLNEHLLSSLNTNTSIVAPLLPLLEEKKLKCSSETFRDNEGKPCRYSETEPLQLLSGTRATAAVKATSSLVAAFRLVQIGKCSSDTLCPEVLSGDLNKEMVESLMKLSYNTQGSSDVIRYTADGRFVTSFLISRVSPFGLQQVGKFREDTGTVWTHPLPGMRSSTNDGDVIRYAVENEQNLATPKKTRKMNFDYEELESYPKDDGIIKEILLTHQNNMSRIYTLILLIWSSIGILTALYIAVYVAVRYCDGTIVGPQVLGGLLLLGVISVYVSCIVYILPPTTVTCSLRSILPNISLALCFSILLLKAMQLRALVHLGVGGKIPRLNSFITLTYMIGIEIALCVVTHKEMFVIEETPHLVELDSVGLRHCRGKRMATLLTQDYLLILLLFGAVLGIANRKIERNHNEGRWLFLVTCICIPVVLAWMSMSFLAPPELEVGTTCAACLILATTILALIFIPKIGVIAQQARDYRHKKLAASTSLSTIFSQMDPPLQGLQPPPPFCDPPYGTLSCSKPRPVSEAAAMRNWREFQDSPAYQKPPAPPPPPPPISRNPHYYSSSSVCYP